jgi:hypothetical protein
MNSNNLRSVFASAFLSATAALLVASCAAESPDDDSPSAADCEAARANQARLVVASSARPDDSADTRASLARHEEILAAVGGTAAIEACVRSESRARLRCVAAAATLDEAARCGKDAR